MILCVLGGQVGECLLLQFTTERDSTSLRDTTSSVMEYPLQEVVLLLGTSEYMEGSKNVVGTL